MGDENPQPAVILLVEDDAGDRELTRRALREGKLRNELYEAGDGEQALDYLRRRGRYAHPAASPRPDLILLDLNLPRIDGQEVLCEMRADPELCSIPVVVLTTSRQEEDIVRSYKLGVNSFVTKPLTVDGFVRVIHELEDYWFQLVVLPSQAHPPRA